MQTKDDIRVELFNKCISRRLALKLMAVTPLIWNDAYADSSSSPTKYPHEDKLLAKLLDILIPRDQTPSATDLQLDKSILNIAAQIPRYPELIAKGLSWLDVTSRNSFKKPFIQLQKNTQIRVIEASFNQPKTTLPRVFIERLRDDVMALYYHHETTWADISINRPIQPVGYPRHNEPPQKL